MAGLNTETLLGLARLDDYAAFGASALQAAASDLANKGGGVLLVSGSAYPRQAGNPVLPASVGLVVFPGGRLPGTAGQTLTINGTYGAFEDASTVFPSWGTVTINGRLAVAGGTVNIPISAATPAAETFGSTGAAGSSGNVSDAGHVHPLSATAGGDLTGSFPNPTVATGKITAAKLANGAATGVALGADVATLTGTQALTNKTLDGTSNALVQIAETVLGASQAQVVFAGVPQTFRTLYLSYHLRDDSAGTVDNLLVQVNGDAGANYNAEIISANGGAVAASEVLGATSLFCGYCVGGGAPAGLYAAGTLRVFDYANTVAQKVLLGEAGAAVGGTTGLVNRRSTTGIWSSTAAINSLTVLSSAGNLIAGSVVTLYGEP